MGLVTHGPTAIFFVPTSRPDFEKVFHDGDILTRAVSLVSFLLGKNWTLRTDKPWRNTKNYPWGNPKPNHEEPPKWRNQPAHHSTRGKNPQNIPKTLRKANHSETNNQIKIHRKKTTQSGRFAARCLFFWWLDPSSPGVTRGSRGRRGFSVVEKRGGLELGELCGGSFSEKQTDPGGAKPFFFKDLLVYLFIYV